MTSKWHFSLAEQEVGRQSQLPEEPYRLATRKLRERVSRDICASLVKPTRLLAIGEQSVKAALPLAELGYEVTGLLDSKTILDYRLRSAEELPVNFKLGEAFDLPFADHQFDTLLGLGLYRQSIDLQTLLVEWQRVLKPTGRVIFDCLALGHFSDAIDVTLQSRSANKNIPDLAALSSESVNLLADDLNMKVAKVIPHGVFDMDMPSQYWHERLEQKQWWKRFVSLLQIDDELLELAVFLELDLVGFLPPRVAPKLMIALDQSIESTQGNCWAQHDVLLPCVTQDIDFEWLKTYCRCIDDAWRSQLNALLKPLRNRVFFYHLFAEVRLLLPQLQITSFLDESIASQFARWDQQYETNSKVMAITKSWYDNHSTELLNEQDCELRLIVGQSLEYMLAQQLFAYFQNKN